MSGKEAAAPTQAEPRPQLGRSPGCRLGPSSAPADSWQSRVPHCVPHQVALPKPSRCSPAPAPAGPQGLTLAHARGLQHVAAVAVAAELGPVQLQHPALRLVVQGDCRQGRAVARSGPGLRPHADPAPRPVRPGCAYPSRAPRLTAVPAHGHASPQEVPASLGRWTGRCAGPQSHGRDQARCSGAPAYPPSWQPAFQKGCGL